MMALAVVQARCSNCYWVKNGKHFDGLQQLYPHIYQRAALTAYSSQLHDHFEITSGFSGQTSHGLTKYCKSVCVHF